MDVTDAERALLGRLAEVGGRYTFKPDGENVLAWSVFEEAIVAVLRALHGKRLVRIDSDASELIRVAGQRVRFASLTAELTDAGRETLL